MTSIALPVCVPAVFQLLLVIASVTVPVVPAFRLTSIPSAPAPRIVLPVIV